jgi:hypothetical protein
MDYSFEPKKFNKFFKSRISDFIWDYPPNRLSKHLRNLVLQHLLEINGAFLVDDEWVADLIALFDFLDDAHKQRKKWKKKGRKLIVAIDKKI